MATGSGFRAARAPGVTHAERVRTEIADEIACGRLAPGAALDEVSLAGRFGVSRTPVREAIRQLAAAGLVLYRAHRGAEVAAVSETRLDEMFSVMAELEALCARYAAEAITAAERAELVGMQDRAAACVHRGDRTAYAEANDAFHAFIYAASHNSFLIETTLAVRQRVNAFRRAQFNTLGRLAVSHAEHERVVQAILRGEAEAAGREMRTHLLSSRNSYGVFQDAR